MVLRSIYNLASSLTVPIFSFGAHFSSTPSLWYFGNVSYNSTFADAANLSTVHFRRPDHLRLDPIAPEKETKEMEARARVPLTFQNCLLASLPPTRFRILGPPGCWSMNFVKS
jgi:hypothetical protein